MSKIRSNNLLILDLFKKSGFSGKTALVLSTWFGSGCLPIAPGTFGTLAAVPLILVLNNFGIWYSAFTLLIVIGIAVWSAGLTEDLLEKKDPSEIVIDEVAGFLLATALLPFSWLSLGLVFFLFRFFDILKPYPIKHLEKLRAGIGIVMDDILAGLYACAGTWVILLLRDALAG
ncbi:MAG: phosphatidylglycerophosphatase A [Deltaproteobacteria bacterium]|nr:phosphatidylglycerophosphatase A [Deltaproteobacteria bacterium]